MRLFVSVFATAAMLFVASTAGAVEFSLVGADSATVLPGEEFTIDIVLTNKSLDSVHGLLASVHQYGDATFVRGDAVANYLNTICGPPGYCSGGLENIVGGALVEGAIGANGNRVQIAVSASLTPATGAPNTDQGLDGNVGTTQFTVTFAAGLTSQTILIDTSYQGDGVVVVDGSSFPVIHAQGATFRLNVIPEPATALLMGLGLAGLAAVGRRK